MIHNLTDQERWATFRTNLSAILAIASIQAERYFTAIDDPHAKDYDYETDSIGFRPDSDLGLRFTGTYDASSCGCCFETGTCRGFLPWNIIEKMMNGEDWLTPAQAEGLAKKREIERDRKKRQDDAAAFQEELTRINELNQLKRLQAKYGDNNIK